MSKSIDLTNANTIGGAIGCTITIDMNTIDDIQIKYWHTNYTIIETCYKGARKYYGVKESVEHVKALVNGAKPEIANILYGKNE